jgi:hypothetical protein
MPDVRDPAASHGAHRTNRTQAGSRAITATSSATGRSARAAQHDFIVRWLTRTLRVFASLLAA